MPIDNRFGVVATAVTQAELSSPKFSEAIETWRKLFRRIVVVIGSATLMPKLSKVQVVRVPGLEPSLSDVIRAGHTRQDRITPIMAVVDPYCLLTTDLFKIYAINKRRNFNTAWVATSLAVKLEHGDLSTIHGWQFELDGLRLFVSTDNIWRLILMELDKVEPVPFTSPVWGGWLANWAQAGTPRIANSKYHDLSELRPVAIRPDDRPEPATVGYGPLVFNPPMITWTKGL